MRSTPDGNMRSLGRASASTVNEDKVRCKDGFIRRSLRLLHSQDANTPASARFCAAVSSVLWEQGAHAAAFFELLSQ
jgi:hypothetical protein